MSYKRTLARWIRDRDDVLAWLKKLDNNTLEDLVRRGQHRPGGDGFPTASLGDGGGASASDDTSTERSALRNAAAPVEEGDEGQRDTWAERDADTVGRSLGEMTGLFGLLKVTAEELDQRRQGIQNADSKWRGRQLSVGDCLCCTHTCAGDHNDRLKNGLCPVCYKAMREVGMPDRTEFIRIRRSWLDARDAAKGVPIPTWSEWWAEPIAG